MGALDGIRILDLTQHQAGPYGGALLADFGADVIKVERPGGDPGRTNHPEYDGVNAFFLANNRGKRSVCLDLTKPEASEIIRALAATADGLVHNLKPGAMEKFGLGYDALRATNQRLIYVAVSTFGPAGPRRGWSGVDLIAQAESGLMAVTGSEEGSPFPAGIALADALGGINVAFAMMTALYVRERTGRGQELHVSLVGGMLGVQAWELQNRLLSGETTNRVGASHPLVRTTWTTFRATDGWFVIAELGNLWAAICRAIDEPELAKDEAYRSIGRRYKKRKEVHALLQERFGGWPREECVRRLREQGILATVVRDYGDVARDADVLANGYVREIEHPKRGRIPVSGPFLHFSETPPEIRGAAPELGAHSNEVLEELGYERDRIQKLREGKVVF